jgi:hypothetical protein
MSGDDEITRILEEVFTHDKFTITRDNSLYFIASINPSGQCLKLRIRRDNNIEIDKLDKCGIQGSKSIRMVEEVFKKIPSVKKIKLTDASTISVCGESIKLSCLKILSKGESWYNSLGYYSSKNPEWEKEANAKIIEKPFHEFLTDCLQKYTPAEFDTLKTEIETNGSTWFPGTNLTDTTQEYFKKINAIILSDKDEVNCSEETKTKYKWLSAFCGKIIGNRGVLRYDESLFKEINIKSRSSSPSSKRLSEGGSSRRRRSKSRRSTRKIKHRNISRSKQ